MSAATGNVEKPAAPPLGSHQPHLKPTAADRGDPPAAGDTVEFWLDDGTRGDLVAVEVTVVPSDSTA
jgi:hypothetical protein